MAVTPKGIYYPTYQEKGNDSAEVLTDMQSMAESVDTVLDNVGKLVVGYYYNGSFYSDEEHTTLITPATNIVYADLTTGVGVNTQIYFYNGSSYVAYYSTTLNILINGFGDLIEQMSGKEDTDNKVSTLSSSSTDTQYPSAKCVYDLVGNLETILETLDIGGGVNVNS